MSETTLCVTMSCCCCKFTYCVGGMAVIFCQHKNYSQGFAVVVNNVCVYMCACLLEDGAAFTRAASSVNRSVSMGIYAIYPPLLCQSPNVVSD